MPDPKPDIRGMAVKFQQPDGTATDLLGQTSPRFPTDSPEVFVQLTEASEKPWLLPLFLARNPHVLPATSPASRSKADRLADHLRRGDLLPDPRLRLAGADGTRTWVRYIFRPTATKADRLGQRFEGADRLPEEMLARLARGPVTHEVWVQVAGDGHDPHSARSVWDGCRELLAGRIEVTAEATDPEGGPMSATPVVFDPTRRRRRHRALRRPDPALPAGCLLGVGVPARRHVRPRT